MIQEFKDFVNKGGVFEAAVGLIMALAFAPVVQGLVDFIIMPIIAAIFGQPNFDNIGFNLGDSRVYVGAWISTIVSFLMIAAVIFFLVKAYNAMNKPAPEEEAGPSEVDLLIEIRDALKRG
ncbi:MAG: large conductance mechanosensitive channel protein MscL [Acidimicrobiales bacterium]